MSCSHLLLLALGVLDDAVVVFVTDGEILAVEDVVEFSAPQEL
jgi:hypothetical protein